MQLTLEFLLHLSLQVKTESMKQLNLISAAHKTLKCNLTQLLFCASEKQFFKIILLG